MIIAFLKDPFQCCRPDILVCYLYNQLMQLVAMNFLLPISPLVPFCVSTKETILWKAVDNKSKIFRFLEQNTKGTKLKGHRRGNFSTVIQHSSWRFAYENIVLKNIFFYLSKGQFRVRVSQGTGYSCLALMACTLLVYLLKVDPLT